MKEIADTIENAKKYAVCYIDIPPLAEFEIRWSREPNPGEVIRGTLPLDAGCIKDGGPMLIACLTD